MKHLRCIVTALLLMLLMPSIAKDWETFKYDNRYSISIPPFLELNADSAYDEPDNRLKLSKVGESDILLYIDYFPTKETSTYPYCDEKLNFDTNYYIQLIKDTEYKLTLANMQMKDIIKLDTCKVNNYPAVIFKYRRTNDIDDIPVIVTLYTFYNRTEYVSIATAYKETEEKLWAKKLQEIVNSFRWLHPQNLKSISKSKEASVRTPIITPSYSSIKPIPEPKGLHLTETDVIVLTLEIISGIVFIIFVLMRKRKRKSRICIQAKQKPSSEKSQKNGFRKWLKRITLSVILIAACCIICGCMVGFGYYISCLFYIPFYLILMVYYLRLIWTNKQVASEDFFLYPLFRKIGLFSNLTESYLIRKALLSSVIPLLLSTVLLSILVVLLYDISPERYENTDDITLGSLLLGIPVIAWIVFFVYALGQKWIDNSKKE